MKSYINIRKEIEICCHGCKYNAQQYVFVPEIKSEAKEEKQKIKLKKLLKVERERRL